MAETCNLLHERSSKFLHSRFTPHWWQERGMGVKENIRKIIESDPTLTVRGVSLAAGLSDSALHKFLTKPDQSMSISNLEKVAAVLGFPAGDLFYEGGVGPEPTEADLQNMIARALGEVVPGTPLSGYPPVVASSLRDQLAQFRASGGYRGNSDASTAPGIGAQPPAPTTRDGQAESRTP